MEVLQAKKANYYVSSDNYIFIMDKRNNSRIYGKCRNNSCWSRCVIDGRTVTFRQKHNHDPDVSEIEDIRFKMALAWRSRSETTSIFNIYMQEEDLHRNAASRTFNGFLSMKAFMYRARKSPLPPIPATLLEAGNLLRNPHNRKFCLELGPLQTKFFHNSRNNNLFFSSPTILEAIRQYDHINLQMDAAVKVVPHAGATHHLFVIHWVKDQHIYPFVYVLMESRRTEDYIIVLNELKVLLNNIQIKSVTCDYENALRKAVLQILPRTNLRGCWFHYAKNVCLKARQLHINYEGAVRMAMVLALLPQSLVHQGISLICNIINEANFAYYMRRQWQNDNVSVYGLDHRTYNEAESFYGQLLQFIGRTHPNFWILIEYLQKVEHYKSCDFIRVAGGLQVRLPRNYVLLNRRIEVAQERLNKDQNIERFLHTMSFSVLGMQKMLNLYYDVVDIENNDNEMPPNDPHNEEDCNPIEIEEIGEVIDPLWELMNLPEKVKEEEELEDQKF